MMVIYNVKVSRPLKINIEKKKFIALYDFIPKTHRSYGFDFFLFYHNVFVEVTRKNYKYIFSFDISNINKDRNTHSVNHHIFKCSNSLNVSRNGAQSHPQGLVYMYTNGECA